MELLLRLNMLKLTNVERESKGGEKLIGLGIYFALHNL
jgi:hypothetical protein